MSFLLIQSPVVWSAVMVALFGGYLSGSVPYGLLLGKLAGLGDIRAAGSGNIGATNVLRLGGKKLGAATLLLDALKGAVPVLIAKQVHMDYAVLAALGAFAGHVFPVWLKFRGGKGVATGIGVLMALSWPLGLALVGVWLAMAAAFRYSSLSAITAFGFSPVLAVVLTRDYQVILVTFIVAAAVLVTHRANIRRLIAGTEGQINLGSKKNA